MLTLVGRYKPEAVCSVPDPTPEQTLRVVAEVYAEQHGLAQLDSRDRELVRTLTKNETVIKGLEFRLAELAREEAGPAVCDLLVFRDPASGAFYLAPDGSGVLTWFMPADMVADGFTTDVDAMRHQESRPLLVRAPRRGGFWYWALMGRLFQSEHDLSDDEVVVAARAALAREHGRLATHAMARALRQRRLTEARLAL